MAKPSTSKNASAIIMTGTFILGNILLLVMAILLDECSATAQRRGSNALHKINNHYGNAHEQEHKPPTSNDAHQPTGSRPSGSHTVHRTATDHHHRPQQTGGSGADDGGRHHHDGQLPVRQQHRRQSTAPWDAPGVEYPQSMQDGKKRRHGAAPDKPRNSKHYMLEKGHFYDEKYNRDFQSMIPETMLLKGNPAIREHFVKPAEEAARRTIKYATKWVKLFHHYLKEKKLEKVNGVWNLVHVEGHMYSATIMLTLGEEPETENPDNPNICCSTLVRIRLEHEEHVPATCAFPVCYSWVNNDVEFQGGLVGCIAPDVKDIEALLSVYFPTCQRN